MERKVFRRALALITALLMLVSSIACFEIGSVNSNASDELTGLTAKEIVAQMGRGWNLGNTFDSTGGNSVDNYETSWSNPKVTKKLIDGVKAAGFDTIRIPVTWYRAMTSDKTYKIDPDYLARIKKVIDYAYDNDMYVILNVHHENWINNENLVKNKTAISKELEAVWKQLASYYGDYDQHLIFEGMNEPRLAGTNIEWTGNSEAYETVNYLNQIFVNTVRGDGNGNNAERCLMIPGYAASSNASVLSSINLPTYNDEVAKNLIVSVHCYSPNDFCLSDKWSDFDENDTKYTGQIDKIFEDINKEFLCQDIPVVIGECSATNTNNNTAARKKWAKYMGKISAAYATPIVFWDNGSKGTKGGECHTYVDRVTGEASYPTILSAFDSGYKSVKVGSSVTSMTDGENNSLINASGIWQNKKGTSIEKAWDIAYLSISSNAAYYASGKSIAIAYKGTAPQIVMDAPSKSVWWIAVAPSKTSTVNGYKVAYFSSSDLIAAMKKEKVTNTADVANIHVISSGTDTVCYEVATTGSKPTVTFMCNGKLYTVSSKLPKKPSVSGYEFLGWYTTKTYDADSLLDISKLTKDVTAYAKLRRGAVEDDKTSTDTIIVNKPVISSIAVVSNGLRLKWTKVSGASGYYIYRSVNNSKYSRIKTLKGGNKIAYRDKKAVKNGAKYKYKIVAYKKSGGKTYKSKASGVKTCYYLSRPKLTSARNKASGRLAARWTRNKKASGYELRYIKGKTVKKVLIKPNKKVSCVVKSLKKKATYKVSVRAYRKVGSKKYYSVWSKAKTVKITK